MSQNATKPGLALSVVYLSMLYTVLLFIRAPLYVLLVFVCMCSVFKLMWLSRHYLPSDWLERPFCGSITVAGDHLHKIPAEVFDCLGLLYSGLLYSFFV